MRLRRVGLVFAVGAACVWGGSGWAGELVSPLSNGSQLVFDVPASWKAEHRTVGAARNLEFSPASSGDFLVLLTVLPVEPGSPTSTADGVRGLVEEMAKEARKTALQERIEHYEVRGEQTVGWLFHVTDRNPEKGPGDFREANQGAVLVGQHLEPGPDKSAISLKAGEAFLTLTEKENKAQALDAELTFLDFGLVMIGNEWKRIGGRRLTVGGLAAGEIEGRRSLPGRKKVHEWHLACVREGKTYLFSFSCPEKEAKERAREVKEILDSFEWLK